MLYTADIPISRHNILATFADDTAIITTHINPLIATHRLQTHIRLIQNWLNMWRIRVNDTKTHHITFTLKNKNCPAVLLYDKPINQVDEVKYLGIHLDKRLTWQKHIWSKRKQLDIICRKLYWLFGRKSKLSLNNKILIYKVIIKPIWTYGIQIWGASSKSNIDIIERFQSKTLRNILNAPWFVPNYIINRDLQIPTVKEEIKRFSCNYHNRISTHPNILTHELFQDSQPTKRLKRYYTSELMYRF